MKIAILASEGAPYVKSGGLGDVMEALPAALARIPGNNISIGSKGESAHPAAYGDKVSDLLWKIYMTFEAIKTSSSVNPYTANIGAAITSIGDWSGEIGDIESPHITID